jgi:hypothetical protein
MGLGLVGLALLVGVLANAPTATAQSGGGYDLSWSTVDGGGGQSSGGGYTLTGTAGQPDAGAQSGGGYTVAGGFWQSVTSTVAELIKVFLPLAVRE